MTLDKLLYLDDKPEMINSWIGDLHVWSYIRFSVYINILNSSQNLESERVNPSINLREKIKYIIKTLLYKPVKKQTKDMLFFSSNVVNIKENNKYINRLCDHFHKKSIYSSQILEESYNKSYFRPRISKVYYTDYINIKAKLYSFIKKTNKSNINTIKTLINDIKAEVDKEYTLPDFFWTKTENKVIGYYHSFSFEKNEYKKLIKKFKPKIVFKEDASYGVCQTLTRACSELNIIVAELQHGLISDCHPAYNFGRIYFNDALRKILPSYLLTFGSFWTKRIVYPGKVVPIGCPYIDDKAEKAKGKNILIVSSGDNPDLFINIINTLIKHKHGQSIVLKLHPREEVIIDKFKKRISNEKVIITIKTPIYDLFKESKIVIGASSTAMYEAFAFGIKPYLFINDFIKRNMDTSIFNTFENPNELIIRLNENKNRESNITEERFQEIWNKNPFDNFDNFISERIGR